MGESEVLLSKKAKKVVLEKLLSAIIKGNSLDTNN